MPKLQLAADVWVARLDLPDVAATKETTRLLKPISLMHLSSSSSVDVDSTPSSPARAPALAGFQSTSREPKLSARARATDTPHLPPLGAKALKSAPMEGGVASPGRETGACLRALARANAPGSLSRPHTPPLTTSRPPSGPLSPLDVSPPAGSPAAASPGVALARKGRSRRTSEDTAESKQ